MVSEISGRTVNLLTFIHVSDALRVKNSNLWEGVMFDHRLSALDCRVVDSYQSEFGYPLWPLSKTQASVGHSLASCS